MSGFREGLVDAWAQVAVFLPKFLGFLLILIIGYFIAKALGTLFEKVLERVGFDKAVERGGVKDALARTSYDASDIVGKLVFYLLFLLVLQLAFGVFGPNPISDLLEGIIAYLPNVIVAIIIIVVAAAVAAAVRELAAAALGNLSWGRVLANVAGGAVLTVGFFAALSQLQIAPAIVNAVFYAILAIIVGSLVIAIGGGGIQPMRDRWQGALERLDAELPRAREEVAGADRRVKERIETERPEWRPQSPRLDGRCGYPGKPGRLPLTDRELVEVLDDEARVLKPHSVDALMECGISSFCSTVAPSSRTIGARSCSEGSVSRGGCAKHYHRFLCLGDSLGSICPSRIERT